MREKVIEQRLIKAVCQSGGLALKLISPGYNGVPDRLLLLPGGRMAFCEVKAPGQKPRSLQVHRMEQLRKLHVIMESDNSVIKQIRMNRRKRGSSGTVDDRNGVLPIDAGSAGETKVGG